MRLTKLFAVLFKCYGTHRYALCTCLNAFETEESDSSFLKSRESGAKLLRLQATRRSQYGMTANCFTASLDTGGSGRALGTALLEIDPKTRKVQKDAVY